MTDQLSNSPISQLPKQFMRDALGDVLVELAQNDQRIVALTANLGESTGLKLFREKFPERFFDVGVAEQNMAAVASGFAVAGKVPFITSYAAFSPGRNWEQIKTTIALNNVPVKIIGNHAGLSASVYGATHMGMEDIALMNVLPNMQIYSPCDSFQLKKLVRAIAFDNKPSYIRIPRGETPVITNENDIFEREKINIIKKSENFQSVIFSTGPVVAQAVEAWDKLQQLGIETTVVDVHTIKPIDREAVVNCIKKAGSAVVIEEHQINGGLGSIISQIVSEEFPAPIEFMGIDDKFGESGKYEELLKVHKLTSEDISERVKKVISRKNA